MYNEILLEIIAFEKLCYMAEILKLLRDNFLNIYITHLLYIT